MGSGRPTTRLKVTFLCNLTDIPDGGSLGALPNARGRDQILLIRQGDRIYAYVNNCPHYDRAPLGWKRNEFLTGDGKHIMCAAHGALFRIVDGACEIGPCLGQSLTAVDVANDKGRIFLNSSFTTNDE